MYYVEMLRVLRALKVFAMVLGVVFLLMLFLRVSVNKQFDAAKYTLASPTAVKTHRIESDGSETTIIDDRAHKTHIEIHEGLGVYRVTVIEKAPRGSRKLTGHHQHSQDFGSMNVGISEENVPGVGHVTTIERNSNLPVDALLMVASFLAAIMATVLGNGLSKENDHLELPWTKPVSRETYAAASIAVDVAGILASFGIAAVAMVAIASLFGVPHLVKSPQAVLSIAVSIFFPLSWYGLLQGMTTSLRRASGMLLGLSWPVAFALPAIAQLKWNLHPVLQFLDTFNPVAYIGVYRSEAGTPNTTLTFVQNATLSTDAAMLFTLMMLGLIAAIVQWRRLEA